MIASGRKPLILITIYYIPDDIVLFSDGYVSLLGHHLV